MILTSIGVIFILIANLGYSSTQDSAWAILSVAHPPNKTDDAFDFTYIKDESGNIIKVAIGQAPNDTIPFFAANKDTRFELFTSKNPTKPQLLWLDNSTTIQNSNFNSKLDTRIFIHGWNADASLITKFAETYLTKGKHKVNFIAVNWRKGSSTINYFSARGRVKAVAKHLANLINFMVNKHMLNLNSVTLIGHSLGAHVAGIAGKNIANGKVGKIVGLDPALPFFRYNDLNGRLTDTDGTYVETIHTCAGKLGYSKPIGMASFYPNGGTAQPGCRWDIIGMCAHSRSLEYYLESIIASQFYAFQCESFDKLKKGNCTVVNGIVQMGGEPGVKNAKGIFYLKTNHKPLYSQGKHGVIRSFLSSKNTKKVGE